jgi:multiple sugar transport system ATP-binding protein
MNVYENMSFGMRVRRVPKAVRDAEVRRVASLLQLDALLDASPQPALRRPAPARRDGRALVRNPKIFLFDEPLSNLDAKLRVEMRTELKKLHQNLGVTIVYVTHDQIEAMTLATKVAVMKDGALQQVATPQEIYDRPANLFVAGFIGSPPMNLCSGTLEEDGGPRGRAHCQARRRSGEIVDRTLRRGFRTVQVVASVAGHPARGGHAGGRRHARRCQFLLRGINVVEPTGADNLAFFNLGEREAVARLPPGKARAGDCVRLQIDPARALIFDPRTQRLVG